jgi:hypothetical protein
MKSKVKKSVGLPGASIVGEDWPTGGMLLDVAALMGTVATGAVLGMLLSRKIILPSFIAAMYAIKKRNIYLLTSSVGTLVTATWGPKAVTEIKTAATDIKELMINSFRGSKVSTTNGLYDDKVSLTNPYSSKE